MGSIDRSTKRENRQIFDTNVSRIRRLPDGPLAGLRLLLWWIRKTFFTRPRFDSDSVVLSLSKSEATRWLGGHHFEPGWAFSYSFRDEILNLRRPKHVPDHPDLPWWQAHVRGYSYPAEATIDRLELTCHIEPDPIEHPDEHLVPGADDYERGTALLVELLEWDGIEYEYIDRTGVTTPTMAR